MRRALRSSVIAVATLLGGADVVWGSPAPVGAASAAAATFVRVEAERGHPGALYAGIGGEEIQIASAAFAAWLLDGGREVAYSAADGAGGYENEGQSLRIYNVQAKTSRKVLAARYAIDGVTDVRTRSGKRALLVEMSDGGLGASHLAIVDPSRGEVFSRSQVKILRQQGAQRLIEQMQPYHGLNGLPEREPLWLLQRMNIEDKHHTLNLVAGGVDIRLEVLTHPSTHPATGLTGRTGWLPLPDGAEIYHFPLPRDHSQMQDHSHMSFDVAFDPEGPAQGIPLRQGLGDMRETVAWALRSLQPFVI